MFLDVLIAACTDPIGCITPPAGVIALPAIGDGGKVTLGPIIILLNLIFKLVFVVGGLFAFLNFLAGGFGFINAGGDPKQVSAAWNKIQGTFLGLIVLVSSFLIAAILGQIFFGNATYFLQPTLILK
ncbi:hypothetical protein A2773_01225 [Candidatus Gottesmanbacteria bacterium RIFCSPHIGHO2_01_FULL_39_10]|uniref:Uncharacterized protein n=1 Tax=Candidatus Gottesmanbacteria bacterium RIFCSPHIGHO2_01_FULL_39_10 TaxID=1798375 RepID=A0A1F5ZRZ2_9BACT|nr:MAG: hypothetical protein A2773_01225 [Candidatus Gottesmanbacteria bacterium RIFCSPHIGHO2_01_FULL_39_10]